ncbi:MAG: hypothetical protein ACJA1C_001470 [Crocinitomicaceae bacterium]|jgi:hypothetical protein
MRKKNSLLFSKEFIYIVSLYLSEIHRENRNGKRISVEPRFFILFIDYPYISCRTIKQSNNRTIELSYIIPGIPPGIPPPIAADSSIGSSVITTSVVNNIEAIEAAFSIAIRVTFVGSTTPAEYKLS